MNVEIGKSVTVGSSNVQIGDALSNKARDELIALASKFFGKLTNGSVRFSRDGYRYHCSIVMQPGGAGRLAAEGAFRDAHGAFDDAFHRLEAQLRKLKREMRDGKKPR